MKRLVVLLMIGFIACTPPPHAHAQFIGYTAPQTEQQTLATNLLCTGAAQTFSIQNLGQTQHYLNIANVAGATKFQAEIDGIDRQGNVLRISDILEPSGAGFPFSSGSLFGAGYFPKVQIQITCSPNTATFTASYSGAWATFNGNSGAYLAAQIDKVTFNGASATVNQTDTLQTPFGSSAGQIYFKYNTSSGALGTLTVQCSTVTGFGGSITTLTIPALQVTLANTLFGQTFQIPDTGCTFATVTYAPNGGGGADTISAEYVFAQPGLSNHASTDPCMAGTFPKTSAVIFAGAAGTTQQVALSLGQSIYVCGYQASQVATAGTVQWVYGTGVNCATGTTNLSGAMGVTASQPFTYSGGSGYVMKVPTGNALCLTTTGAGGTVSGIITFIQSP